MLSNITFLMNSAFLEDWLRGVDSVGGQKLPSPIDKASRR